MLTDESEEKTVDEIVNDQFNGIMPTLHEAARQGCNIIVQHHLNNGVDVNIKDNPQGIRWYTPTPLHYAVQFEHTDTITLLIKRGADVNARDSNCAAPLHIAAQKHRVDIVMILLEHGANINATDLEDRTLLHYAAKWSTDILKRLLEYGADILAKDYLDNTPIMYSNHETLRFFIRYLMENPSIKSKFDLPRFLLFSNWYLGEQGYSYDLARSVWNEEEQLALAIQKLATMEALAQTSYDNSMKPTSYLCWLPQEIILDMGGQEGGSALERGVELVENVFAKYSAPEQPMLTPLADGQRKRKRDENDNPNHARPMSNWCHIS